MPDTPALEFELTTALGPDLLLRSASVHEEMSRLFEMHLTALSEKPDLKADDLLATPAGVSLVVDGEGTKRWLCGLVTAFGIDGVDGRYFRYRLALRPWLWLATRNSEVRIFQNKTAPDIIKAVLEPYGGTLTDGLEGTYTERLFCVQYRESDFNFVCRLMEEEGINWFFRHTEGDHALILADRAASFTPVPSFGEVLYLEDTTQLTEVPALSIWGMRHEVQTGKLTLRDWDWLKPSEDITADPATSSARNHASKAIESYDYPGLYTVKADGTARAKLRLEEAESRFARFHGQGNEPCIAVGARFKLKNHPREDQNVEYVPLATQLEFEQSGFESGEVRTLLRCTVQAQPFAEPVRPQRITRKPTVAGPQTAIVVGGGAAGSIETDEHARVKVQFHWDRLGQKNADSSCWVRVASPWAGNGWGMLHIPRVGQEVVVDFLEGDPDQPLITGRVYNAEQKPPYPLPANASVSTIKSRSVEGAAADFNELRFEDKKGSEYVLFHAQKDRLEFVEAMLKVLVEKEEHRTVKENFKEEVKGEYHFTVTKPGFYNYKDKFHLLATGNMQLESKAVYSLKTAQDFTVDAGAAGSLKTATDVHIKAGTGIGAVAGTAVHIKGGTTVVVEAGAELTLKCGPSFVVLGPSGVAIKGPMVMINSGGAAGSGAGASPVAITAPDEAKVPELPEDPLAHR